MKYDSNPSRAGIPATFRGSVPLRLRARDVQVAVVAARAEGEAAHHLGVQDPLPRRALPDGPEEGHFRRRRPDRAHRFEGARRPGPAWRAVWVHADGR